MKDIDKEIAKKFINIQRTWKNKGDSEVFQKYVSITKVSKATAVRDLASLIEFDCIRQIENTSGRNIRYEINIKM